MESPKRQNGGSKPERRREAEVIKLLKKGLRRGHLDLFAEDFCRIHEVAARDVAEGRLPIATWNSMRGGYGNILRMIDGQMRARKMGIVSPSKKLLEG